MKVWCEKFFSGKALLGAIVFCGCSVLLAVPDSPTQTFGHPLNTQNVEYNPVISPRGRYIVFQSNRPGGKGGMDIWVSTNLSYPNRLKVPVWSEPENFSELNSPEFEGMFSILFGQEDDRPEEFYFTSLAGSGRNGYQGLNLYYTERIPGSKNWKTPIPMDDVNSQFNDRMPAISPDGKILVFSSDRPGGWGGFDLWVSFRSGRGEKWSEPINVGKEINSSFHEISPSFHWDGETIFFSSDRNDPGKKFRFFKSDWQDGEPCRDMGQEKKVMPYRSSCWSGLAELGFPFNTQFFEPETSVGAFDGYDPRREMAEYRASDNEGITITHDDLWVYYSSNRPGGMGQFDIYRSPMPDTLRKSYDYIFYGLVLDGSEPKMIGLDSTIKIFDKESPIRVLTSARIGGDLIPPQGSETTKASDPKVSLSKVENFRTNLKTGKLYRVEVSSPGFHPTELTLDLRGNIGRNRSRYETIVLQKIEPVPPKTKDFAFGVYNKKTGEAIPHAQIRMFTPSNRSGVDWSGDAGRFTMPTLPTEDFELHVKATGYKEDTFFFQGTDLDNLRESETRLYLTNLSDIDQIYSTVILFPFNVDEISTDDKQKLDRLAQFLLTHKDELLEIGGHTDNVASREYNIRLSQSRAQRVKDYLLNKGVPEKQIKLRAYYYSQPAEDNSTAEGRAKNRRVNFKKLN